METPPLPPPPPRNRRGCLGIFLFLALCASLAVNLLLVASRGLHAPMVGGPEVPKFDEQLVQPGEGGKTSGEKIVQISLRGLISSSVPGTLGDSMVDDLKMQIHQAVDDKNVKAIVLVIDSPGGEVTASDIIYQAVAKARDEAKKPVVVYMDSLAASGGYYVSCAGSYAVANETTLTGSIGVIMESLNYQQLFGKVGLETVVFKSGKFKDMMSGSRPMTDEEKGYIQNLVMQTYGKFVGIVARERKINEQTLRDGIADGRVVTGKDALENKLVDQLGTVEDAYAKAMQLANAGGAPVVKYEAGLKLGRLLHLFGKAEKGSSTKVEVSLGDGLLPKLEAGRLYFLPPTFVP